MNVHKREKGTKFDKLVECINKRENGLAIVRESLLFAVYGYARGISRSTVDKWRRQLTVIGHLEETKTPGMYIKVCDIPPYMTTTLLEKLYTEMNH